MAEQGTGKKRKFKFKLRKSHIIALRVALVVLVILVLFFMAAETLGLASVSKINDNVRSFFTSLTPGEGYPYKINSSSVRQMDVLNGNIFVLTNGETMSLDSTAKVVKNASHTYSTPVMSVNNGKAIVFNRDDNRYRVENRTETLYTGETATTEKIITCAIGKSGNIAIATTCDSAVSKLSVLNNNYKKEVYAWKCASDSIIAVSLSDNGKYAAVAVIGARDGEIFSKIYIFDFEYQDPVSTFEYPGTAIIDLNFVTNNKVVAIGDNLISFIDDLDEKEDKSYESNTLSNYCFAEDGTTVLVLSEYGSTNSQILTSYTKSFGVAFEEKLTSSVKSIHAANSRVSVLLDGEVLVYKGNGKLYKDYVTESNAISVFNIGKNTYVYSMGKISKCTETK